MVAEAHSLGFVHRDLKPPNFFVVRQAGAADEREGARLRNRQRPGSGPSSCARLEAARAPRAGRLWDRRSTCRPNRWNLRGTSTSRADIWALGVTLFELLSGNVPYEGRSLVEIYSKIRVRPAAFLESIALLLAEPRASRSPVPVRASGGALSRRRRAGTGARAVRIELVGPLRPNGSCGVLTLRRPMGKRSLNHVRRGRRFPSRPSRGRAAHSCRRASNGRHARSARPAFERMRVPVVEASARRSGPAGSAQSGRRLPWEGPTLGDMRTALAMRKKPRVIGSKKSFTTPCRPAFLCRVR